MSKGGGTGGLSTPAGISGKSGASRPVKGGTTSPDNISDALKKSIQAFGGIAKSVTNVSKSALQKSESQFKGLTKSEIQTKSNNLNTVHVIVKHSKKSMVGGGELSYSATSGAADIAAAKSAGASTIRATITTIGKRGKKTTTTGIIKL